MDIPVIRFTEPLPCATIIAYDDDGTETLCNNMANVGSLTPSDEVNGGWLLIPICRSCVERMNKARWITDTP